MTQANGEGQTASCYLREAERRPNLEVKTGALTDRVTIDGKRATGVSYRLKSGAEIKAAARREVILAAGALATPTVLMRSGLGPAAHLQQYGIAVAVHKPQVGANFQDHLAVPVFGLCKEPVSVLGQAQGLKGLMNFLQWYFFRTGLVTSTWSRPAASSTSTAMGDATCRSRSCRSCAANSRAYAVGARADGAGLPDPPEVARGSQAQKR